MQRSKVVEVCHRLDLVNGEFLLPGIYLSGENDRGWWKKEGSPYGYCSPNQNFALDILSQVLPSVELPLAEAM